MAKARAKKTEETSDLPVDDDGMMVVPSRGIEALGIGMLILALGLCFALFSFDPGDAAGRGNLVGPLGSGVARTILGGIGVAGYVVGLLGVALAGATLFGRVRLPSPLAAVSAASLMIGTCVLAQLVVGEPAVLGHPAGGALGLVLSELLRGVAGPAGAALFGVGLVLLGVIGISNLSFSLALQEGFRAIRFVGAALTGRLQVWREASAVARQREAELLEAARSRRAQARMEQDERARLLQEDMDEKRRMAVLKATAKAEEKALKKIAALEAKARVEQALLLTAGDEAEAEEVEAESSEASTDGFEVQDPAIVSALPVEADDEEVGEVVLSSEPQVVLPRVAEPATVAFEVQPSADVIDDIDRRTQLPAPARRAEPEVVVAAPSIIEEVEDDEEDEGYEDEEALSEAPAARPARGAEDEASTGELVIHERKACEAHFEDDAPAPVKVEEEKPVYELPPINLLDYEGEEPEPVDSLGLKAKATRLEEKLKTYGVDGKVTAIRPGPVVTTYEYQPAPGVKVSKIQNLSDDIAMSMEAVRVRIVAPIPGRGVVGIELPNDKRENVYLKEVVAHDRFKKSSSLLTLALGKDAEGEVQIRNLQKMPHLLIAGTTGSGKSVSINTMVLSVLYKATPDQVKFIMVDPKMLELSLYNDIPHLLLPVVTDPKKASLALQWAVDEMERRYQMLSDMKVRDIGGFNKKLEKLRAQRKRVEAESVLEDDEFAEAQEAHDPAGLIKDPWRGQDLPDDLPYIVVLIDEFADLMCVAPRDVEASVQRLAQKARAAGIHVLLATQRPSTDVITGVIKNNFPSRISFRVASRHDSGTILNSPGAENLLGMGDSLFLSVASPTPERIHGAFVSEDEVERVVDFWKAQAKPKYDETILQAKDDDEDGGGFSDDERDEHYDMAVKIVTETKRASISALQRRLRVGYNRAARMVEMMEHDGIVGPPYGPKGEREVLVNAIGPDGPPRS